MKKVTFFLGLMLTMLATNVWAQEPLSSTPVPDGYYYIRSTVDAYGLTLPYIVDPGSGSNMNLSASNDSEGAIWQIKSFDATNYNAENGKKYHIINYKTGNGWVAGPAAPIGSGASYYNIFWNAGASAFNFSGRSDGNIGNAGYVCANSATSFTRNSGSAYCNWQLIPVQTATVTFNYKYAGETVKTTTATGLIGKGFPTPSLPYMCTTTTSLPETLTGNCTVDVEVETAEGFPFQFSTSYADATWYTWKMRNSGYNGGYAGFNGTNFKEDHLDAQPTAAKYMFAFIGNPFGFKVLCANGQFMVNNGGGNEMSTTAQEGTIFSIGKSPATATWGEFYIDIPGKTGTLNDVNNHIGYWANSSSYSDTGSQITIDESVGTKLYQIEFAANTPAAASVTYNGETFTQSSAVLAIAAKTAPLAADFTASAVKDFRTEIAVEGTTVKVTYITTKTAEWIALGDAITSAKAITTPEGPWGNDPGYYNKDNVDALPGAITIAEEAYNKDYSDEAAEKAGCTKAKTDLEAAVAAADMIMPEVGKTYQIINGFPTFEATQGHKKAMYCDGAGLVWKQVDDADKSFYWTVTKVDGKNVTFQNAKYGTYPIGYTTYNQKYPVSETENYCLLTSLGQGQFNILPKGAGAALHAGNHGGGAGKNGNVMIWDAGVSTCSSWYIHDASELIDIVSLIDESASSAKESQATAESFLTTATPTQYEWTTDTEQFSSNRPCSAEGSLSNLLDGDATTFFHSDWTGTFPSAPYHELYVNGLDDSVTKYDITYMRRSGASNDHVTQMEVYGGTVTVPENPDSEGAVFEITSGETPLAVIDLPYTSGVLSGEFFLDLGNTGYEALCFKVTNTNAWNADKRGYFHFGEFHMYDHNRLVPADVDVPAQFRALLEKKIAKLQALLDSPVLNAEYADKIDAAKAEIDAALQDAKDNIKANRTFAETNKSQLDITAGKKGSKARASIEFPTDLVVAALGINDIDEAIHYAINGSAGYKISTSAKYVTETGYRNAKGDVCAKSDAALQIQFNGGKFYVTPLVEFPATTPSMNIYTVYTANEIAFLFQVQVNFVAEEGDNATAINSVNTEVKAAGIIYDLTGRKVSSLKAGQIYIVNGQKVMIK